MNKTSAVDRVSKWLMRAKRFGFSSKGFSKTKTGKGLLKLVRNKK